MQYRINWIAVLVATVAAMFVGFLFYGLFFAQAWQDAIGLATTDGTNYTLRGEPVVMDPVTPMIVNAAAMFGYALFMGWLTFKTGHTTLTKGVTLGALLGLVVAAGHFVGGMFSMETPALGLIDGSYHVALFAVIGAVMGGWRKGGMRGES